METMTTNLKRMFTDINTSVDTLTSSATELSAISEQMTAGVQNVSEKSATVSAFAEEMSANMNSVAAAMEQSATNIRHAMMNAAEVNTLLSNITSPKNL
jgi:methyl-accepting chemotaxis protein